MSSTPRVSIIIPFLNARHFMSEAVDSVHAQTFGDWEIVLVDDGSTDGSSELASQMVREHPGKIRSIRHPGRVNRGISASLNLGIREARGSLIALLDADDFWFPTKLEDQVAILDARPDVGMVYGRSQFWFSWTGKGEDRTEDWLEPLGVPVDAVIQPPDLLVAILAHRTPSPCPCSVLLRKSVVESVGGFEEVAVGNSYSDQSLYSKLLLKTPVFASGRCWARYRQHPDSAMAIMKKAGGRNRDRRQFLEWFAGHLQGSDTPHPAVRNALQAELEEVRYRMASRPGRFFRDPARAVRSVARRAVPRSVLDAIRRLRSGGAYRPPNGRVRFGDLRRLEPLSRDWGYDRGLPVDRHYIEDFLQRRAADIRGRVLEIGDDTCTWRFGREAVTRSDVLNVLPGDPKTTLLGDLNAGDGLPGGVFDCIIFTETLQVLYDFRGALRTLHRMLKPGGVLLATFPGITKVGRPDDWGTTWFWSFTPLAARRLFEETFPGGESNVDTWGNVLSATAFLWGLAANELTADELDHRDPEYPVTITIRAVKRPDPPR